MTGWHHESPTNHGVYISYFRYYRILSEEILKQKKIATMNLLSALLTLSTVKSKTFTPVSTPADVELVTDYRNDVWVAKSA